MKNAAKYGARIKKVRVPEMVGDEALGVADKVRTDRWILAVKP